MLTRPAQTRTLHSDAERAAGGVPALIARAEQAALAVLSGDHRQRRAGAGEQFWQFREYRPGDRLQDIDWRQSARTDAVFVRQKEQQTPQTTLVWHDANAGMHFSSAAALPTKLHAARVLALALAILSARAGERTGLLGGPPPGRAEGAVNAAAHALENGPSPALNALPAQPLPRHAGLVLTGDFIRPSDLVSDALEPLAMRSRNGILIQVLDPAELDLPYRGRVLFSRPGSAQTFLAPDVGAIRDAYKTRLAAHGRRIEALCRSWGWRYALHRTDTPYEQTLRTVVGNAP